MRAGFLVLAAFLLILPLRAAAADGASLIADHVEIGGNDTITATGNVEVLFGATRLTATAISYNDRTGALTITGPIVLTDGGDSVILADAAELDGDLKNGILSGARLVLNQQLQLAAAEIARIDGRYTQLVRTVASSCQVCAANPVPLWQIRATRIVHDQEARQLYFENARVEIAGVPVFYLPRLRMPDPSATRATGFLVPRESNSSKLGISAELPFFVALGDSRDLTIAPLVSAKTRTVKLRYRQAFRAGEIELNGAVTRDDLLPDATRAYLFATGRFDLPRGFALAFDAKMASDPTYLATYDISSATRLDSTIDITRSRDTDLAEANLTIFRTLGGNQAGFADQLPRITARLAYDRRFTPGALGGAGLWSFTADAYRRDSNLPGAGRDGARIGTALHWGRTDLLGRGFVLKTGAEAALDGYLIADDPSYDSVALRSSGGVAGEISYPMIRQSASGATQMLTPLAQLAWSASSGGRVPNEDSRVSTLDEGNLFAISRFAGEDRREGGMRAATGLVWARHDPAGWQGRLAIGTVVFDRADPAFTASSGLTGTRSDLLIAGQLSFGSRLNLDSRALLGWDGTLDQADTRISWQQGDNSLSLSHSWQIGDAALNRPNPVSELALDGSYRISRFWLGTGNLLYDLDRARPVRARFGLQYENECVRVDLSLSRRFKSSANVVQDTDIGLEVGLLGFGSGRVGPSRVCYESR